MSERRITSTYEIVTPSEEDDEEPECEQGWEDEDGADMEPDEYDVEEGVTAVDKAISFLKDKGVTETSATLRSVGDWYSTEGDQDYRTGATTRYSFFLEGFSPEEEHAVYRGVFPQRAAADELRHQRWRAQEQEQQEAQRRRHRRLAAARPHGICERADHCVEHASNSDIPSCKGD